MVNVDRYNCSRCEDHNKFHVIIDEEGISFLRCTKCDRTVDPEHQPTEFEL